MRHSWLRMNSPSMSSNHSSGVSSAHSSVVISFLLQNCSTITSATGTYVRTIPSCPCSQRCLFPPKNQHLAVLIAKHVSTALSNDSSQPLIRSISLMSGKIPAGLYPMPNISKDAPRRVRKIVNKAAISAALQRQRAKPTINSRNQLAQVAHPQNSTLNDYSS